MLGTEAHGYTCSFTFSQTRAVRQKNISSTFFPPVSLLQKNMLADLSNISVDSRVKSVGYFFLKVGPVIVNVV